MDKGLNPPTAAALGREENGTNSLYPVCRISLTAIIQKMDKI